MANNLFESLGNLGDLGELVQNLTGGKEGGAIDASAITSLLGGAEGDTKEQLQKLTSLIGQGSGDKADETNRALSSLLGGSDNKDHADIVSSLLGGNLDLSKLGLGDDQLKKVESLIGQLSGKLGK